MNADKVIIHRFNKLLGREVYVTDNPPSRDMYIPVEIEGIMINIYISYDMNDAKVYGREEGTKIRDFLNKEREGHQYLWLMKEV